MKTLIPLALVTLTAVLSGCSGNSSDDGTDSTDDAIKSASHPSAFVGTWTAEAGNELPFNSYYFESDGSYSAFGATTQSGSWKVEKSGPQLGDPAGASELALTDSSGKKDVYFYSIEKEVLDLSSTFGGKESKFDRAVDCATATFQACDTPADCTGSLPAGSSWGCANDSPLSACNYSEPVCVVIGD